ncbi:MAG: nitrogenase molybdenum-iron protein alpha chain, partial [Zavarzinia sp.]|nr:nitrogenase molybdenum-iron protein alpha chain [Zavarzinia sp.]
MSLDYENDSEFHARLIEEVLEAYPDKSRKRRAKHLSVAKDVEGEEVAEPLTECDVKSNIKSVPGVMTIRGCAYAGSKGVVWGPVKDMV